MVSIFTLILLLITTTTTITTLASASTYPKTLLLTVTKDIDTFQYTTKILQRTPVVPITLTLDLTNPFLWVVCEKSYVSSTFHPLSCGSPQCKLANASPKPDCSAKNTCRTLSITNPVTGKSPPTGSDLATDVVKFNSTDGSTTTQLVTIPNFIFACAPKTLLQGLGKGMSGVAGLGRSKFSIASPIFGVCLPQLFQGFGAPENGAVFLGDGPYNYNPAGTGTVVDLRTLLTYTPLISNPVFPTEYFVGVRGITVDGKEVPINKSLLSINKNGHGGTSISLAQPYTVLETSIFKALTTVYDEQFKKRSPDSKRVTPVPPFELCYDRVPSSRPGIEVSNIKLVLQSDKVVWPFYSTNVIVRGNETNLQYCLAFVDGGRNPRTSIVIGGNQIENNFVQFDVPKKRLGFSNSLITERIGCNLFNFTSKV